jgi:hypothetical protein
MMGKKSSLWTMDEKGVLENFVVTSSGAGRGGRMARTFRKSSMTSSTMT